MRQQYKAQQAQSALVGKKSKTSMQFSAKFVEEQTNYLSKPKKTPANQQQRYQHSPEKQAKPIDTKKPAWERLLERSFDQNSVLLIKQRQRQLNNANSQNTSPGFGKKTRNNIDISMQSPNQSQVLSPKLAVWKQFLDKTADEKVQKSDANYCKRRTEEGFLSGRTVNPQQYASHADVLLVTNERQKSKLLRACESNADFRANISGSSKGLAGAITPRNEFKLSYAQEELNKIASYHTSPQRKHMVTQSNRDNFGDISTPNKSQVTYIGSPNIKTLLSDRKQNLTHQHSSTLIKNQRDFRSNISCLSNEMSPERDVSQEAVLRTESKKYYRNLLTTFETGTLLKQTEGKEIVCTVYDKKQTKKRVQAPYETRARRNINDQFQDAEREKSQSRKLFRGVSGQRDIFTSQIANFS